MRFGNFEIPGGLLVMPAFVLVISILLLWSWYYYSRQTKEMERLAASRGWAFLGKDCSTLEQLLNGIASQKQWLPENVILVQSSPDSIYLFDYQANNHLSDAAPEVGTGCLAEGRSGRSGDVVIIDPRPPLPDALIDSLMDNLEEAGGPEFRRRFLVHASRPDAAAAAITPGVEEAALLRHTSRLKWDGIWIAGQRVLVTVRYALKTEERDALIDLAKRLLAALP
jgi:hypothetical protein